MAKRKTETDKPQLPVVSEEKGGVPAEMQMDAGTEIMKSEGQGEIQAAVVLAKRFPRDEGKARAEILTACDLEEFAGGAYYSFPRGNKQDEATGEWKKNIVSGPSIRMAREAARVWGNIRYGFFVTHDDDDARGIVAWAWDLEKNLRTSGSDFFKKIIQRKKDGQTLWVTADEREMRELTFRKAAILIRNAILQLMPGYFVDHLVEVCKTTAAGGANTDIKDRIVKMQRAFRDINIPVESLERYLGKPIMNCGREDLADLRGIYKSITDGIMSKEEREEMFGSPRQPTSTEEALRERIFGDRKKPSSEATIGKRHEGLSMENVRSAKSQAEPHPDKVAPKKEEKKVAKGKATTKPTNGKSAEPEKEKFDPKETALALIRNATKQNWNTVKETVLGMVKEIKGSQNLLDVTSAINNRQREMLK